MKKAIGKKPCRRASLLTPWGNEEADTHEKFCKLEKQSEFDELINRSNHNKVFD